GPDGIAIVRRIIDNAGSHLTVDAGLLCEIGRDRWILEEAYPETSFLWLETEGSTGEVFWVGAEQLVGELGGRVGEGGTWPRETNMKFITPMIAALACAIAPSAFAAQATFYQLPPGAYPHDVAPAPDGAVWYSGQQKGILGRFDPKTGKNEEIPLGRGAA